MNAVVFRFRLASVFLVYFGISMVYCPVCHRGLLGVFQACGLGCWDGQRTQEHALTPSDARDTALAVEGMSKFLVGAISLHAVSIPPSSAMTTTVRYKISIRKWAKRRAESPQIWQVSPGIGQISKDFAYSNGCRQNFKNQSFIKKKTPPPPHPHVLYFTSSSLSFTINIPFLPM